MNDDDNEYKGPELSEFTIGSDGKLDARLEADAIKAQNDQLFALIEQLMMTKVELLFIDEGDEMEALKDKHQELMYDISDLMQFDDETQVMWDLEIAMMESRLADARASLPEGFGKDDGVLFILQQMDDEEGGDGEGAKHYVIIAISIGRGMTREEAAESLGGTLQEPSEEDGDSPGEGGSYESPLTDQERRDIFGGVRLTSN